MDVLIIFLVGVIIVGILFGALFYLPLFLYVNHVNNKSPKIGGRTIEWRYVFLVILGVPLVMQVLEFGILFFK